MIGQIAPLVQGDRRNQLPTLHVAGGLLGGSLAGLVVGTAGWLLASLSSLSLAQPLALALLLAYVALADLGVVKQRRSSRIRQTPGSLACTIGRPSAVFVWGVDLGAGVLTTIPQRAFLALLTYAAVSGSIIRSVAVMGLFGLARALTVITVAVGSDPSQACTTVDTHADAFKRLGAVYCLALSGVLVSVSL